MPFSASEREQQEIRDCGQIFFDGGNPAADSEIAEYWEKWKTFFDVFMLIRDARYGNLLMLPFDVSAFEQPVKTTRVIQIIQAMYIDKIVKEQEKAFQKK